MKQIRRSRTSCLLLLLIGWIAASSLAGSPVILPLSDVEAGMKGHGLTVFSGEGIQKFDVTVIDVIRKVELGRDMILIRCSGQGLEQSGVIAGMSGSPIYLEGKLAGALSSGWMLAKAPLAGVTPIEEMLAILKEPASSTGHERGHKGRRDGEGKMPNMRGDRLMGRLTGTGEPPWARPIATPLYFSGFHPRVLEAARKRLRSWNIIPMSGGGSSGKASSSTEDIRPGSALAVSLVSGDMSVAGVGTVTWRQGNDVLAFGHPMVGAGPLALPMGPAVIHGVVPNHMISFKLGSALEATGVLLNDRAAGVFGRIGAKAETTPVRFGLRNRPGDPWRFRNISLARDRMLAPTLLSMAASSLVVAALKETGELTVNASLDAILDGGIKVRLTGAAATRTDPVGAVMDVISPLMDILSNPLEPVLAERIRINLEVEGRARIATLDSIRLSRSRYRPGDPVEVTATIRTFGGRYLSRTTTFDLPQGLEAGNGVLSVMDAETAAREDKKGHPSRYEPGNLEDLIAMHEQQRSRASLWIRLSLPMQGATLDGRELPSLPGSVLSVLSGQSESGIAILASNLEVELPTGFVIEGNEKLSLQILRREAP